VLESASFQVVLVAMDMAVDISSHTPSMPESFLTVQLGIFHKIRQVVVDVVVGQPASEGGHSAGLAVKVFKLNFATPFSIRKLLGQSLLQKRDSLAALPKASPTNQPPPTNHPLSPFVCLCHIIGSRWL